MRSILLASAICAVCTIAVPRSALASTTQTYHSSGQGGQAFFQTISGCIETDTYLQAAQFMGQGTAGGPGPQSGLMVNIFQANNCTQTVIMAAFGWAAPTTLQMSRKLDTGAVTGSVQLQDWITNTTFTVSVSLSWTGTGPVSRSVSNFHSQWQGYSVTSHFNGAWRQANAGGSVTDGSTEWAGPTATQADLFSTNTGTVSISRP